jgi:replicative DNA helicase
MMVGTKVMDKEKIPPHDIDAEEGFIGSLILNGSIMGNFINTVKNTDFYSERNSLIYDACVSLYKRVETINQITISQELFQLGKLESAGGAAFLSHLISICPTWLDADSYAEIITRLAVSRRLINLSAQISDIGYQGNPDTSETVSRLTELTNQFRKNNTITSKLVTPIIAGNDIINLANKYKEPSHTPSWGFKALDDITAGIYPEYIVVGARPSVGKTEILLNIAEQLSYQGKTILFASAEMMTSQIYERKLSREVGIGILELRKKGLTDEKEDKIIQLAGAVSESKTHYLAGDVYLNDIYREASLMLDEGALDIIFIDYLGALRDCYTENKDNQNVRISRVSNRLQSMVHEFKVPIIVASQLNREIEKRGSDTSKPQLSDLRDSGSIEQDADVVFLLHRDTLDSGEMEAILKIRMAKNRQLGSHKPVKLIFNIKTHRYQDCEDGIYTGDVE